MKRILIVGSTGQIGSELSTRLRSIYGASNVICGYYTPPYPDGFFEAGPTMEINALHIEQIAEAVSRQGVDTIYNLVAILSATAEKHPKLGWDVGTGSLMNCLDVAREYGCAVFTPSSIGAFGPDTPKDDTPQDTIQRPNTIYGITKVLGELVSDYYFHRWGVDTRSVRFPGIISSVTPPGGGTTDYAVDIFYKAVLGEEFVCPIAAGTFMDMMYMPDALDAAIAIMEADPARLVHRNSFNVASMSFDPEMICAEIRKHIPDFRMRYEVDPLKQHIADSWPNRLDDSCARDEWGWQPSFDIARTTADMIGKLKVKLG
ncbi:MAG: NAD-dependent epimerase/dehydratase family protein [Rikenellaceae bacterium]|jgi:nucleoside-diphosphate-sugar epimerase|nr:NAD-dependent epimerase/dehydratase family protein [Rikenellaceae bacterium]